MREEHIAVLGQFCAEDITNFSRLQYTSTLAIHIVLNNKTLTLTSQGYAQSAVRNAKQGNHFKWTSGDMPWRLHTRFTP